MQVQEETRHALVGLQAVMTRQERSQSRWRTYEPMIEMIQAFRGLAGAVRQQALEVELTGPRYRCWRRRRSDTDGQPAHRYRPRHPQEETGDDQITLRGLRWVFSEPLQTWNSEVKGVLWR